MTNERSSAVAAIRASIADLQLADEDFETDRVVDRLAVFRINVAELAAVLRLNEAWLVTWLKAEQYKGALLYSAAKLATTRTQFVAASGPQSHSAVLARFNIWSVEVVAHLDDYKGSEGTSSVVAQWTARAASFRANPLNPAY
jgi:hypothetical protein